MKYSISGLSAFIFSVFFALCSHAAGQTPELYASFDQDFRAVSSEGIVSGEHSSILTMETLSMLLLEGVKGKAAKIGTEEVNGKVIGNFIHYPARFLDPAAGTIAFWLKPLDWDFMDGKFHIFCEAKGPDGWLVLYKYGNARDIYFLYGTPRRGGPGVSYVIASARASNWRRGEFHHVSAVWDKMNIRLYLDGILKATVPVPAAIEAGKFDRFSVGPISASAWKNQEGNSIVDEFQVYRKPLSGAEVEKLFSSYGIGKIDKSGVPVTVSKLKMMDSPDGKFLNLSFFLSRSTMKGGGFPVEMEILRGNQHVMKKILQSPFTEYHHQFRLKEMEQGEYLMILRPQRELAGDKIENRSFRFTVGDPKPMEDHSVPSPWEPVVFKDGIMSAKMQRTDFSAGLLPSRIYSEATQILREPMRFICNSACVSGKAETKIAEEYPDYQTVENRISGDGFSLTSRCRFEFDGMMWFQITLTPEKKLRIENAKIEIPLKSEFSKLYNRFVKEYFQFSGFHAGRLDKSVKCNHFLPRTFPGLWVGNEERGLYYFTQDQAGRRIKNRAETVRLDPGKNGALLTINLIDYPSEIASPVTWSFGLQVTPVRPFVRNRVLWRPEHNAGFWFPWETIHNVPDARFAKSNYARRRNSAGRNGKIPLFHYFAGFSASPESPGYPAHAHDWSITPPSVGTEVAPNDREWKYVFVCANSEKYRNAYLRGMEKCIRELEMDNLYFDNCWSWFCDNSRHGCGWQDENGNSYPTFNVLGSRELAKGGYRILRRIYPEGHIVRHISQTPEPPLIAFADCMADGECFMTDVGKDESYFNLFTPDSFRASFMGNPLGTPSVFIAQFNRAYQNHFPEKLKAAKEGTLKDQRIHLRHFTGYAIVHDTGIWPNFGVDAKSVWNIMDRAGITDNSPFFGYWNSGNPVKKIAPKDERVMVSCYICPDGALAVLMNDTDAPVVATLELDSNLFGASPVVVNAENNEKADPKAFHLPKREFRLLRIIKK